MDGCAAWVAAEAARLRGRIPAVPAARLGRISATGPSSPSGRSFPPVEGSLPSLASQASSPSPAVSFSSLSSSAEVSPRSGVSSLSGLPPVGRHGVLDALRELGVGPAERLLGALELAVADRAPGAVPDLPGVPVPVPGPSSVVTTSRWAGREPDSDTVTAAALLEQQHPGTAALVGELSLALAGHPAVRAVLTVPAAGIDEAAVAAGHGAAHLAFGVAVARLVVDQDEPWPLVDRTAAVVGLGLGAAVLLLREAPMPPAYAAAVLDRIRAEYRLPRHGYGSVPVSGHRFALVEGDVPAGADVSANGLVAVVDAGAVIRTGAAENPAMSVQVEVRTEAPDTVDDSWDDVVEVSWRAANGLASVRGPAGPGDPHLDRITPPGPGDFRLRVHATGRDDPSLGEEGYLLVVWAAPPGPPITHKLTDALGHRLRGEPEPDRAPRPELAYRWIGDTWLQVAATVTVVTGSTVRKVKRAFEAGPGPADLSQPGSVGVLDIGGAVVAVEVNGFRGSEPQLLERLSAGGRAASMFWNVNALTRLSFAEQGRIRAAFEPMGVPHTGGGPDVEAALAGLDFDRMRRPEAGLLAVERFTGHAFTREALLELEINGRR